MILVPAVYAPAAAQPYSPSSVTSVEKKAFLEFVLKLPREHEGFTKEAGESAAPKIGILLALTPRDINEYFEMHLAYLIGPILEPEDSRKFCIQNFSKICHPTIKIICGSVLFQRGYGNRGIVDFLLKSSESKEGKEIMESMSDYDEFLVRLKSFK